MISQERWELLDTAAAKILYPALTQTENRGESLLIISGEYLVLDSHTQILFVAVEKKKKVFEFIFFLERE